ncbi:S9 family peptidase, partial [Xanthomonas oryzae pv. oryzae]
MIASHRWTALFVLVILMPLPAFAGTPEGGYRQPPEPLLSVMRAPLNPSPRPDPTGRTLLLVQRTQYPPIARVAEPYLKLAGVRVEPRTHSRHDMSNGYGIRSCLEGFSLVDIASGKQTAVSLPAGACPALPVWSPDGRRFAFNNTAADHVELWVGDVATGQVRKIDGVQLNPVLGGEIQWLGGSSTLLLKTVPQDLGPAPRKAAVPPGPEVKETIQGKGESSTYEARDTLSSPQDEALFTYYATAQLLTVDAATGSQRKLGTPAVYSNVDGAPDGRHVLVERLKPPYSYVTTYARFAHDVAVLDLETGNERVLANLPVADRVPVQGVPTGPRAYAWRANQPATLVWAEALDG